LRGLAIARGQHWPLVNDDAYIGALFNYLIAALFQLTGPSPLTPRLLVLTAGLLTIWLTYLLGRECDGRWSGLLAAGLLTTAALHIIICSRVAWSHSLTPLPTTASLLLLLSALRRRQPAWLVASGLFAGLALQTHPTALVLPPTLAGTLLLDPLGRRWLRSPWLLATLAAGTLGCLNLLWYNLIAQPGQALREANAYDYAFQVNSSPAAFGAVFLQYAVELVRIHGSVFGGRGRPNDYLLDPAFLLTAGLLATGLTLAVGRRRWSLPLLFLIASLLLPLFGRQFRFLPDDLDRYLALLLPAGCALMAGSLTSLVRRLLTSVQHRAPAEHQLALRRTLLALSLAASLALIGAPLSATLAFQHHYAQRGETARLIATVEQAVAARNGAVFVDERLNRSLLFGGGHLQLALLYLLELRGVAWRTLTVPVGGLSTELRQQLTPGTVLIVHESSLARLDQPRLEPLKVVTSAERSGRSGYGVYRVTAQP
jgi:4-amino-4-deoxy-L-arabinose transferase-like glycosyltransferase